MKEKKRKERAQSYFEILVGLFLPLLGHGVWCRLGEHATRAEEDQADEDADGDAQGNLLALIGRRQGAGPVRAERNPVGCFVVSISGQFFRFRNREMCSMTQLHSPATRAGRQLGLHVLPDAPTELVGASTSCLEAPSTVLVVELTGLLLLEGQLIPILLHTVAQGHPQFGLLGEGHALPPLLDVGQGRVRDGVVGGGRSDSRGGSAGDNGSDGRLAAGLGETSAQSS